MQNDLEGIFCIELGLRYRQVFYKMRHVLYYALLSNAKT